MRRLLAACALLPASLAWPAAAQMAGPGSPFASAMIDRALFRDGEVERSTTAYGAWTLVCDAIPRLNRRFCSLTSAPTALGTAVVVLTVSTGDDGRPAALLRLPFGLALASGIVISGEPAGRGKARHVPIAVCDRAGCQAIWTLGAGELGTLRQGKPLRVALQGWTGIRLFGTAPQPPPMLVTISGLGFPEALSESLR